MNFVIFLHFLNTAIRKDVDWQCLSCQHCDWNHGSSRSESPQRLNFRCSHTDKYPYIICYNEDCYKNKGSKVHFFLSIHREGNTGEWSYSSTHSQCRHWMIFNGQFHALASVPWGKATLYPQSRRLDGLQWQSVWFS